MVGQIGRRQFGRRQIGRRFYCLPSPFFSEQKLDSSLTTLNHVRSWRFLYISTRLF